MGKPTLRDKLDQNTAETPSAADIRQINPRMQSGLRMVGYEKDNKNRKKKKKHCGKQEAKDNVGMTKQDE